MSAVTTLPLSTNTQNSEAHELPGDLGGRKVSVWTKVKNFCHEHQRALAIALIVIGMALFAIGLIWGATFGLSLAPVWTISGRMEWAVVAVKSWTHVVAGYGTAIAGAAITAGGTGLLARAQNQ